jgi:hypothetical protein
MRLRTVFKLFALGLAAHTYVRYRRARQTGRDTGARWDDLAADPGDPVQGFDEAIELQGSPLDVDVLSNEDLEAAQDLARLEVELDSGAGAGPGIAAAIDAIALDDELVMSTIGDGGRIGVYDGQSDDLSGGLIGDPIGDLGADFDDDLALATEPRDAGDLYGAHTPAAVDRVHPDDDHAMADGQSWLEALETSAIENGAEPERELDDLVDDEDLLRAPHPADRRDTPVADHGSGGRRGL